MTQNTTRRRRFAWWHELQPMTRRGIRVGLALVLSAFAAAGFAISTASYEGSVGPHVAEYSTRLNGEIRLDMGPLGALVIESPLPAGLGVDVLVREIPDQLTASEQDPIAGLTADLNNYSQFMANPQATIDDAARGLTDDALGRWVVTWCVLLMMIALGRLAAHGVLRDAAKSALRQPGVPAVAVVLAVVLVVLPLSDLTRSFGSEGRGSQVLDGTPLADARITGRLATIVDHYGGYVVSAVEENSAFYAEASQNLREEYRTASFPLAPPLRLAAEEVEEVEETGGGQGDPDAGAEGDDPDVDTGETGDAEQDGSGLLHPVFAEEEHEYTTMLMIADLHCNMGMAEVIGAAAELAEADVVLNAGDTVVSGTSVESHCVSAFADGIGTDVPVVVADGNHDSVLTAEQERDRGWQVLDGEVLEVAGVRILGDTDPTLTEIGTGTRPERDETVMQMGDRLRDQACELQEAGDPVDIVMVHSPYAGRQSIEAGCVPLTLAGHMHSQMGPMAWGLGVQYISGSTAGAALGQPTIGPLQSQAAMTVIRWDLTTGLPAHYRLIHIESDSAVSLSPWRDFPAQPTEFIEPEDVVTDPDPEVGAEDPQEAETGPPAEEGDPGTGDQNLPEDESPSPAPQDEG